MSMFGFKADRRNDATTRDLKNLRGGTERAIRQTWFELGKDLKREANEEILHGQKTGQVYIIRSRGGRRRRHRASAPGETHANLTGKLRRSLSWVVHGTDSMDFGYGFSTTEKNRAPGYEEFVEDGTIRMAARPSLLNAINKTQRETENQFHRAMTAQFHKTR